MCLIAAYYSFFCEAQRNGWKNKNVWKWKVKSELLDKYQNPKSWTICLFDQHTGWSKDGLGIHWWSKKWNRIKTSNVSNYFSEAPCRRSMPTSAGLFFETVRWHVPIHDFTLMMFDSSIYILEFSDFWPKNPRASSFLGFSDILSDPLSWKCHSFHTLRCRE